MRKLLALSTGFSVIAAIVMANLWYALHAERQLNADLQARLTKSQSQIHSPVVQSQRKDTKPDEPPLSSVNVDNKPNSTSNPGEQSATLRALRNAEKDLLEKDLLKDPEYHRARLAQIRASMRPNYLGLAEELGLTEWEADQLFDLLAEHQIEISTETSTINASSNGPPDQAAMELMAQKQQQQLLRQKNSIAALLGTSKFEQFQNYEQSRGTRNRANQTNLMLAQAGHPLTATQTRTLTGAMLEEQNRQRQLLKIQVRDYSPTNSQSRARLAEEQLNLQSESNRRILDAVAPHLDAMQLAALRSNFEQQISLSRASSRLQVERDRAKSQISQ